MRIAFNSLYSVLQQSISDRLATIQTDQDQVSSGKAVTRPSQGGAQAELILAARHDLERRTQYGKDAADAERLLSAALSSISGVQDVLSEAGALSVRAGTTLGPVAAAGVAAQLNTLVSRLVEAGNRAENGRYIFGGHETAAPPFQATVGALPGGGQGIVSAAYAGDSATPSFAVSETLTLGVGVPGTRLSAATGSDLITTLIALRDAVATGNAAGVTAAQAQMALHGTAVSRVEAELGSAQSAASATVDEHARMQLELTGRLSTLEDADVAAVLVDLNKQQVLYQAALQTMARINSKSLFDYI
jgi:flagellar hook-associated protein 3 FlgL